MDITSNIKKRAQQLGVSRNNTANQFLPYNGSINGTLNKYNVLFRNIDYQTEYAVKNEFFEPVNSDKRFVQKRSNGLRTFTNFVFSVGRNINKEITTKQELENVCEGIRKILRQESFALQHPIYPELILVSLEGNINERLTEDIGQVDFSVTLKEVSGTPIQVFKETISLDNVNKKRNALFTKIKSAFTTITNVTSKAFNVIHTGLDYAQASAEMLQNAIVNVNKITNSINEIANKLGTIQGILLNSLTPISTLKNTIASFQKEVKSFIATPSLFADRFNEVFNDFGKISDPNNSNVFNRKLIELSLSNNVVNAINTSDALYSNDEQEVQNHTTLVLVFQISLLSAVFEKIIDTTYDNFIDVVNMEKKLRFHYDNIILRRIYLGLDIYQDPIYYYYTNLPDTEKSLLNDFQIIANIVFQDIENKKINLDATKIINIPTPNDIFNLSYNLYGNYDNVDYILNNNPILDYFRIDGNIIIKDA